MKMNKLHIIGRLVRDPELRTVKDGIAVCTFTVAVNRRNGGAKAGQIEADFFRVTVWRGLAENCSRYLTKGRQVAVTGSVSVNAYTTQNGETKASLEVNAEDVEFLSPKSDEPSKPVEKRDKETGFIQVDETDQLPF